MLGNNAMFVEHCNAMRLVRIQLLTILLLQLSTNDRSDCGQFDVLSQEPTDVCRVVCLPFCNSVCQLMSILLWRNLDIGTHVRFRCPRLGTEHICYLRQLICELVVTCLIRSLLLPQSSDVSFDYCWCQIVLPIQSNI